MNWFQLNTDQVRVLSRLTYFFRSNRPLLKFRFPDFSLQSFEILTWNFVYIIVPHFRKSVGTLNLIRLSVRPSVRPSVCHKNFNLAHIFWSIKDRALIFGMHDPCDKPFQVTPCRDLDLDLWPSSRSKLLPSGGPQFSEFACLSLCYTDQVRLLSLLTYFHFSYCPLLKFYFHKFLWHFLR